MLSTLQKKASRPLLQSLTSRKRVVTKGLERDDLDKLDQAIIDTYVPTHLQHKVTKYIKDIKEKELTPTLPYRPTVKYHKFRILFLMHAKTACYLWCNAVWNYTCIPYREKNTLTNILKQCVSFIPPAAFSKLTPEAMMTYVFQIFEHIPTEQDCFPTPHIQETEVTELTYEQYETIQQSLNKTRQQMINATAKHFQLDENSQEQDSDIVEDA